VSANSKAALLLAVQGAGRSAVKNPESLDQGLSRRIRLLKTSELHRDPDQPRRVFDETTIERLAETVKAFGILSPIVVRTRDEGGFTIVLGERRYRAAVAAGIDEVPTIAMGALSAREQLELQLLENVGREDLNVVEEGRGYARLLSMGASQRDIALKVGRSEASVSRALAIVKLPEAWLQEIEKTQTLQSPSKLYEIVQAKGEARDALWAKLRSGASREELSGEDAARRGERRALDPKLIRELDAFVKKLRATYGEVDRRRIHRRALVELALRRLLDSWDEATARAFLKSID
jgi:ParB family chromosome partitioning protein